MPMTLLGAPSGLRSVWENLAEGWRDLVSRSSKALTRFVPHKGESGAPARGSPTWGLVAGDVKETRDGILVQVDLPGVNKRDCTVDIDGRVLRVRGEKRHDRDYVSGSYVLSERAYGRFEREILLPPSADASTARATLRDGVLTVEMRKGRGRPAGRIEAR